MKQWIIGVAIFLVISPLYALPLESKSHKSELIIARAIAESIGSSIGYDDINDILYVTFWNRTIDQKKIAEFNAKIQQYMVTDRNTVLQIYWRLLYSRYMIEYRITQYKEQKRWNQYYYFADTLAGDSIQYVELLRKAIIAVDPEFAAKDDTWTANIKRHAIEIMQYRDNLINGNY